MNFLDTFELGTLRPKDKPPGKWDAAFVDNDTRDVVAAETAAVHPGSPGTQGLHIKTGSKDNNARVQKNIQTSTTTAIGQLWTMMWFKVNTNAAATDPQPIMTTDLTDLLGSTISFGVKNQSSPFDQATQPFVFYTNTTGDKKDWVAATGSIDNAWHCVETHTIVSPVDGTVQIWVDGALVTNRQGLNTGVDNMKDLSVGNDKFTVPAGLASDYFYDDFSASSESRIGCPGRPSTYDNGTAPARYNGAPMGLAPIATDSTPDDNPITLSLQTDEPAVCKYSDKSVTSFGSMTMFASDTAPKINHVADPIQGLELGKSFSYYVKCQDSSGKVNDDDYQVNFTVPQKKTVVKPIVETLTTSTYQSISIEVPFDHDDGSAPLNNNNSATFRYKGPDQVWHQGMDMTVDRRDLVTTGNVSQVKSNPFTDTGILKNPYKNEWRASVLTLQRNTPYTIEVTFADADSSGTPGVTCPATLPASQKCTQVDSTHVALTWTVKTRDDNFPSSGQTLTVDGTNGTDPADCTLPTTGFKTIQKGINCANQGDTVKVKAGTYKQPVIITKPGTADNYITLMAESPATTDNGDIITGAHAVIDPSSNPALDCGVQTTRDVPHPNGANTFHYDSRCAIIVKASFVRVSGFEIVGGPLGALGSGNNGIVINNPSQFVVVDHNYIHDLTYFGSPSSPVMVGVGGDNDVDDITVQSNNLHAPAVSGLTPASFPPCAQFVDNCADPDPGTHIINVFGTNGGHVFRKNKLISDNKFMTYHGSQGIHGSDCIANAAQTIKGLGRDVDIYENYCDGVTDDGFQLDGGGMNVRVWSNTVTKSQTGFSIAPVEVGPSFIFRNLVHDLLNHWSATCLGVKTGESGSGFGYVFQNTFYHTNSATACNGKGSAVNDAGGNKEQANLVFKNNIFDAYGDAISIGGALNFQPTFYDPTIRVLDTLVYDANLYYSKIGFPTSPTNRILQFGGVDYRCFNSNPSLVPAGCTGPVFTEGSTDIVGGVTQTIPAQEKSGHGVYGQPTYVSAVDFHLKDSNSLGVDKAVVLVGFNDPNSAWPSQGKCPDMGAFESPFTNSSVTGCSISTPTPTPTSTSTPTPTPTLTPSPTPTATPTLTPSPTPTSIPTPSSCQGADITDFNTSGPDGKVDIWDYNALVTNFGKSGVNLLGDITSITGGGPDGKVDINDYNIIISNFGKTGC